MKGGNGLQVDWLVLMGRMLVGLLWKTWTDWVDLGRREAGGPDNELGWKHFWAARENINCSAILFLHNWIWIQGLNPNQRYFSNTNKGKNLLEKQKFGTFETKQDFKLNPNFK
jgi:hypothetical protein